MSETIERSRRFYEEHVIALIRKRFPQYESRIAVGLAGEGSDCFGYDDFVSRDHDFGTGVCLWIEAEDMEEFGYILSILYNQLADRYGRQSLSERLKQRRGVMSIGGFYSGILGISCDTKGCTISDEQWRSMDHACLATAVNGEVFRDDAGVFSAFREKLKAYYPVHIWRERIAGELHRFASALQVNYARCMTRGDTVAAQLCKAEGLDAAMKLYFLMKREYPPYYKWTYRRLCELDGEGAFSATVQVLAQAGCEPAVWKGLSYNADALNRNDRIVMSAEKLASEIVCMMKEHGLVQDEDPYLELYVDTVMKEA